MSRPAERMATRDRAEAAQPRGFFDRSEDAAALWRTHSCVPRRHSCRRLAASRINCAQWATLQPARWSRLRCSVGRTSSAALDRLIARLLIPAVRSLLPGKAVTQTASRHHAGGL